MTAKTDIEYGDLGYQQGTVGEIEQLVPTLTVPLITKQTRPGIYLDRIFSSAQGNRASDQDAKENVYPNSDPERR